jgi:DNA sulfur modification protein DndD
MRLLDLSLENWGPYIDTQVLNFETSPDAPIVLIHGENMRGKTSIMRALRFALFGDPGMTHEVPMPDVREFANWDARDSGEVFEFGATLRFEHGGSEYQISRSVKAQAQPGAPFGLSIERNPPLLRAIPGNPIPVEDIDQRVKSMFHPQVADFFLFDGEMLDRFEEVLRSDDAGSFVREQIEMTLGVPALLSLRDDLTYNLSLARESARKIMKSESDNKKLSDALEEVEDTIRGHQEDLGEFQALLGQLKISIDDDEKHLVEVQGIREYVVARQQHERVRDKAESDARGAHEDLKASMDRAWWLPLAHVLPSMFDEVEISRDQANKILRRRAVLEEHVAQLTLQLSHDACDRCGQNLPESAIADIRSQIENARQELANLGEAPDVLDLERRASILRPYSGGRDLLDSVREREKAIRRFNLQITQAQTEIDRLTKLIGEPEFDVVEVENRLRDAKVRQQRIKEAVDQVTDNLRTAQAKQRDLENQLTAETPSAFNVRAEIDVYERLLGYINESIENFRSSMKQQVQRNATDIFRRLTTEPDYAALRIGGNYYLQIVDGNDRPVERRSAGASEIVTISLIGALGECADDDAPIVMDTPFGRLDSKHRANILEWLASRDAQAILFVQSGEFIRDRDLSHLKNRVGREYRLQRLGASSTRIEVLA